MDCRTIHGVFRSLDSNVPKRFVDDVVKRHVAANPRAAVFFCRMEIVPADDVWITNLLIETVEKFRYVTDSELH
jgi:hypothetical protein